MKNEQKEPLLPKDVSHRRDLGLILWKPRGLFDEKAVNEIIRFLKSVESRSRQPLNRYTDLTALQGVDVDFKYVFHVALYRRLAYSGEPVKSAFLVTDPEVAHYVKLHALLTNHSPLHVSLFDDTSAAALWLNVPETALVLE